MKPIRLRRSALYVPASNARAIEKAVGLGADIVILDLEDAVAPSEKAVARERIGAAVAGLRQGGSGAEVVIRVNGLDTPWGAEDLDTAARTEPDAILLPKISMAADIEAVRARLRASGRAGPTLELWAMIETPRAVLEPLPIALAADESLPLGAMVLGLNDLARLTGTRPVAGRAPMLPWMMNVLAAARVAGLDVLDGVYNDIADPEGLAAECAMARDCGFDGKTLVHPGQIAICHDAFSPSPAEIAMAERIAAVFARPENRHQGVVQVDGRMVERLHAESAVRLLAMAASIRAKSTD